MQTLSELAETLGISIGTVRNKVTKYKDATGIDFFEMGKPHPLDARKVIYPQEAVDDLLAFINPNCQVLQSAPVSVQTVVAIESGNHRTTLDVPQFEQVFDLAQFRDVESISFNDPLVLAEQFLQAADALEAGMDADIQRQRQQLEATEQAKKQIEAKAQELSIKRHIYSDRIDDLAARQNVSTADLQKALKDLNSLGKPAGQGL